MGDVPRRFPGADTIGGCYASDAPHLSEITQNVNALRI